MVCGLVYHRMLCNMFVPVTVLVGNWLMSNCYFVVCSIAMPFLANDHNMKVQEFTCGTEIECTALQFFVEKWQKTSLNMRYNDWDCTVLVCKWTWLYLQMNVMTTTEYAHSVCVCARSHVERSTVVPWLSRIILIFLPMTSADTNSMQQLFMTRCGDSRAYNSHSLTAECDDRPCAWPEQQENDI